MKKLGILAAAAIAATGIAAPAAMADPCTDYGPLNTGTHDIGGLVYVDNRDYFWLGAPEGHGGLWIYVESNGQPGMQRGGSSLSGEADSCQESGNPDMLIF